MIKFFPDLDLTNNLVGVLIRFRKYPVAVVGGVRAMLIQVRVAPVDQSALRFLWWNDSDPTRPPKDHLMIVHCFGLTNSPSVAGFALRRTAEENRASVWEDVVEVVRKNIYVNDVLTSAPNIDSAVKLVHDVEALLKGGGFELAKLSSNLPEVLEGLPAERLASERSQVDLYAEIPKQKMLGLVWYPQEDVLGVKVSEVTYCIHGVFPLRSHIKLRCG